MRLVQRRQARYFVLRREGQSCERVKPYSRDLSVLSGRRDGDVVAAAQEERCTGKKGDASFQTTAIDYCLPGGWYVRLDRLLAEFRFGTVGRRFQGFADSAMCDPTAVS